MPKGSCPEAHAKPLRRFIGLRAGGVCGHDGAPAKEFRPPLLKFGASFKAVETRHGKINQNGDGIEIAHHIKKRLPAEETMYIVRFIERPFSQVQIDRVIVNNRDCGFGFGRRNWRSPLSLSESSVGGITNALARPIEL